MTYFQPWLVAHLLGMQVQKQLDENTKVRPLKVYL